MSDIYGGSQPRGDDQSIVARDEGAVRVITINNPSRLNALGLLERHALLNALREAESEKRTVVLTGMGKLFSAGGNIKEMTDDPVQAGPRLDSLALLAHQLVHSEVPTIAAVEGGAYGAGLSIVSASTYVVSSKSARFEASFGKIGLAPDGGLTWTLPRRVGHSMARRMMLTFLTLEGETALNAGLVDELVDDGQALRRAIEVATSLSELSAPMVSGLTKLLADQPNSIAEAAASEIRLQKQLLQTRESIELRAKFLKRSS